MRRLVMMLAAVGMLAAGGASGFAAEAAVSQKDCRDYCAEKAAERCEDIHSSDCSAFIAGCLAGCGMSFPC